MRIHPSMARRAVTFVAAASLLIAADVFAKARDEGGSGRANPIPVNARPYGRSYAAWSAAWWQWAYSLPVTGHPLFDETGVYAAAGQSGPVWFLGGVFNVSGTAHRTITVPTSTALFFPIINVEWDNVCPPTDPPLTVDELRATASSFMDLVTELVCEVDGRPIQNLFQFRVASSPFLITVPDDNIWQLFGCPNAVPGTYGPAVGDGFYIMLYPLSAGAHTLHFRGTVGPPVGFTLDIVYDITVTGHASIAGAAPWPLSRMALSRVAPASGGAPETVRGLAIPEERSSFSPNPTDGEGVLRFTLSRPGPVVARLYDASGRTVRVLANGEFLSTGSHELRVDRNDGNRLGPGLYFYRITTNDGVTRGRVSVTQ